MNKRKKHNPLNRKMKGTPQQIAIPGMEAGIQRENKYLYLSELYSGQPYQRPVKDADVNRLLREWNPCLLNPLVVSYRDGKYYLVDGQHRAVALRQKNDGKDVAALCQVYRGLTYEQEAELYYRLDRAKGHLRLPHATKALLESGSNPELLEVNRLLEDAGFIWALDKPTGKDFEIASTRTVINAYRLLGGADFSRMLFLLAETWHGEPASLKSFMLSGMALFIKTYETELKDTTFIKRMSTIDPDEIIRRGKVDFSTNKAALRFARVIWDKYNGQQRGDTSSSTVSRADIPLHIIHQGGHKNVSIPKHIPFSCRYTHGRYSGRIRGPNSPQGGTDRRVSPADQKSLLLPLRQIHRPGAVCR